jgi:hypothetical protein
MPKARLGAQAERMKDILMAHFGRWYDPVHKADFGFAIDEAVGAAQSVEEPPKIAPCGDHRDCVECINLADCCPVKRAEKEAIAESSTYTDGGILFCTVCGTALGDADQDDTESVGVKQFKNESNVIENEMEEKK